MSRVPRRSVGTVADSRRGRGTWATDLRLLGETRRIVFTLQVPALPELGVRKLADLVLRYVAVGERIDQRTLTVPVVASLVSADEAAAQHPDLEVQEEVLVLAAATARNEAIRLADEGNVEAAQETLRQTAERVRAVGLEAEAALLDVSAASVRDLYDGLLRKQLRYEANRRQRGPKRASY